MGGALAGSLFWAFGPCIKAQIEGKPKNESGEQACYQLLDFIGPLFSSTALTAAATIVLALFTWRLYDATNRLWKANLAQIQIAERSAEAAMLSARASIGLNHPIIRIKPDNVILSHRLVDGSDLQSYTVAGLTFSNLGRNKAFPVEVSYGMTCGESLPPVPSYTNTDPFRIDLIFNDDAQITPRKSIQDCRVEIRAGDPDLIVRGELNLWLYCQLTYDDFMDARHTAGFCWKWTNTGIGMAWRPDNTPAYNKKTYEMKV